MFDMADANIYQWTVDGRADGQDVKTVLHFLSSGLVGDITSQDTLTDLAQLWRGSILPLLSAEYSVERHTLERWDSLDVTDLVNPEYIWGLFDQLAAPGTDVGGIIGNPLPTYATVNVQKLSAGGATTLFLPNVPTNPVGPEKRFKGRSGLGTFSEDTTTGPGGNEVTSDVRADVDLAYAFLLNPGIVNGANSLVLEMVILSKMKGGIARRIEPAGTGVIAFQPVIGAIAQPQIGTQNSRKKRNNA